MHQRLCVFPVAAVLAVVVTGSLLPAVADAQPPRTPLALEPAGSTGEAVWPAYEAWSRNADGSRTLLVGYYNRNDVAVDIPIGPDNHIGPGQDMGQPTHFLPGRNWGVFSITVPADDAERKLNWTLRINNQLAEVEFWANPPYFADPFLNVANGNVPPVLKVGPAGEDLQGPPHGIAASYSTTVGEPLTLLISARDQPLTIEPEQRAGRRRRPPLTVIWKKYRGPGQVTFEADGIDAGSELTHGFDELTGGETMTSVTFDTPGQYRLMATGNDVSGNGGGGDQCCWTNGYISVAVSP